MIPLILARLGVGGQGSKDGVIAPLLIVNQKDPLGGAECGPQVRGAGMLGESF